MAISLACCPMPVSAGGFKAKSVVTGELTMSYRGDTSFSETIKVSLRTDGAGRVAGYDLSPLMADVCRRHFMAARESDQFVFGYGFNNYSYGFSVNGTTVAGGDVLFGTDAVAEDKIVYPYLLRRTQATIHAYQGLPITIGASPNWNMAFYNENLGLVRYFQDSAPNGAGLLNLQNLDLYYKTGRYYIAPQSFGALLRWNDASIWNDDYVWMDDGETAMVWYPLVVHPSPVACIRSGAKIYVRYWNSRGAWSYALLDVLRDNLQSKSTYSNAWREGFMPVNGRVFGDRVMTEQELTYTITAGRDGLDKLEVDELRDLQRAYCVQVYDVDQQAWKDCYVQDMTTQNSGGNRQELTFTIEMPHEYTFTR